jgi:hypothetical protein
MFESAAGEDAAVVAAGAEVDAAALDGAAADEVGAAGVEDVELDEEHAASTRQPAVAVTARSVLMGRIFIGLAS